MRRVFDEDKHLSAGNTSTGWRVSREETGIIKITI